MEDPEKTNAIKIQQQTPNVSRKLKLKLKDPKDKAKYFDNKKFSETPKAPVKLKLKIRKNYPNVRSESAEGPRSFVKENVKSETSLIKLNKETQNPFSE